MACPIGHVGDRSRRLHPRKSGTEVCEPGDSRASSKAAVCSRGPETLAVLWRAEAAVSDEGSPGGRAAGDTASGMARSDAEVIRRATEALNRAAETGELRPMIEEFYDPAFEYHPPPGVPEPGPYRGHDQIEAFYRFFRDARLPRAHRVTSRVDWAADGRAVKAHCSAYLMVRVPFMPADSWPSTGQ
jgi:hypothetical protein